MPFFGICARKVIRCDVHGGTETSECAPLTDVQKAPPQAQADLKAKVAEHASVAVGEQVSEQRRLAQERARKEIEGWAKRDAEAMLRQQAAAAAEAKGKIDLFLMAYGYGGVNWRRSRWMKVKYPLHSAVKHRDAEMITLLLRAGANPLVKNSAGETPKELAQKLQDSRILEAFTL